MSKYKQYKIDRKQAYHEYEMLYLEGMEPHKILKNLVKMTGVPRQTLIN